MLLGNDKGIRVTRKFNLWVEKIQVMSMSVGQEKELMQAIGLTVCMTYERRSY